jgi:hypothetical protein
MKHLKFSVLVHTPVTEEPFEAPAGVTVSEANRVIYFDAEGLSLLNIVIEIGRDVAAPILAAWLYDRFVNRKSSKPAKETKINERVITFGSRDQFIQIVEREITNTEEK